MLTRLSLITSLVFLFLSCGKAPDSPKGCLTSFIIAVEKHDMPKAWGLMGSEAQKYYNTLGEKQRRSGKGAFEREVNRIKAFFNAGDGYTIKSVKDSPMTVKLVVPGGKEFNVEIIDEGGFKIKNEISVKNILDVIAEKIEKADDY